MKRALKRIAMRRVISICSDLRFRLLPTDRFVVSLTQTAIDESFVHRTRPLLARQAVNYAARNTGGSAAGSAHRGACPSAPQYRASGCSSRRAYSRFRTPTNRRLLQCGSDGTG